MTEFEKTTEEIKKYIPTGEKKWNKYFGLDKFRYLMELVANPQDKLKFVHITGTCGKGSTAYIIASILKESGYKTGLHVSPHIYTPQERAQINGELISKDNFCRIYKQLLQPIKLVEKKYLSPPSYYEILLAIAFIYFNEQKCDVVVVEVGLGGKLDSTNIIKSNYQVITNIGLDHISILGNTKELILRDKQEINKPNSLVISGIKEKKLKSILIQKVASTNSHVYFIGDDFYIKNQQEIRNNQNIVVGSKFDLIFGNTKINRLILNMVGKFQIKNAAVATATCLQMAKVFSKINTDSIKNGVFHTSIPGRWECLSTNPMVIVDGAHNPDKTKALTDSIKKYYPAQKWITVYRYKRRKDTSKSLAALATISQEIIVTGSKGWGDMGYDETYSYGDKVSVGKIKVKIELNLDKAVELAISDSKNKFPILATGSLFMIKEFKDSLKQKC